MELKQVGRFISSPVSYRTYILSLLLISNDPFSSFSFHYSHHFLTHFHLLESTVKVKYQVPCIYIYIYNPKFFPTNLTSFLDRTGALPLTNLVSSETIIISVTYRATLNTKSGEKEKDIHSHYRAR